MEEQQTQGGEASGVPEFRAEQQQPAPLEDPPARIEFEAKPGALSGVILGALQNLELLHAGIEAAMSACKVSDESPMTPCVSEGNPEGRHQLGSSFVRLPSSQVAPSRWIDVTSEEAIGRNSLSSTAS
eukprot:412140-Amphidinium_carterae.1